MPTNYHRKYSPELIEQARKLYEGGHSITAIARDLGFSSTGTLRYHLFPESRQRLKERVRRWTNTHPQQAQELRRKAGRAWLERNHEKSKESRARASATWRKHNPEKVRENFRKWRLKNMEKIRAYRRAYYRKNREKFRKYGQEYRERRK